MSETVEMLPAQRLMIAVRKIKSMEVMGAFGRITLHFTSEDDCNEFFDILAEFRGATAKIEDHFND